MATELHGALPNFLYMVFWRGRPDLALFRSTGTNTLNAVATIVVGCVAVYLHSMHIAIPIKSNKARGMQQQHRIPLMYTGSTPIFFQAALLGNLYFMSQQISKNGAGNLFTDFLGQWQLIEIAGTQNFRPVGGLIYYLTPPENMLYALANPIRFATYTATVCATCALSAKYWAIASKKTADDLATQMKEQGVVIQGHSDRGMTEYLRRYLPAAGKNSKGVMPQLGGALLGLLVVAADTFGVVGGGAAVVMLASTLLELAQTFMQHQREFNALMAEVQQRAG